MLLSFSSIRRIRSRSSSRVSVTTHQSNPATHQYNAEESVTHQQQSSATPLLCRNALRAAAARVLVQHATWDWTLSKTPSQTAAAAADVPPHEATAPLLRFDDAGYSLNSEELSTTEAAVCRGPSSRRLAFRRFDREAAFRCLSGKYLLFYGNSNTRTLYTALEALLRGSPHISRVQAKQQCDNSKRNHSCSAMVTMEGFRAPVALFYWGYTKGIFHPSLRTKIMTAGQLAQADIVVANAGANVIQGTSDGVWERAYEDETAKAGLADLLLRASTPGAQFWWHSTTQLCPHQPHFRRYKYESKYWSGRTMDQMNAAVARSNRLAERFLGDISTRLSRHHNASVIGVIDGDGLIAKAPEALCKHYDDPLHHRFLDRELVQLLLNVWCLE